MISPGRCFGLCLALIAGEAAGEGCSRQEAYTAETVTDYIDSWRNLRLGFKQFKQCDDGAIAEGFSDAVGRMLANRWSELAEFRKYAAEDAAFERFVLAHIDATVHPKDLEKIVDLAQTQCPEGAGDLCAKIIARPKEARANQ